MLRVCFLRRRAEFRDFRKRALCLRLELPDWLRFAPRLTTFCAWKPPSRPTALPSAERANSCARMWPSTTVFIALHDQISEWLKEQREISGRAAMSAQLAYAAHERIFNAIAAHDAFEAQAAMQDHLDQVAKLYWKIKKSDG